MSNIILKIAIIFSSLVLTKFSSFAQGSIFENRDIHFDYFKLDEHDKIDPVLKVSRNSGQQNNKYVDTLDKTMSMAIMKDGSIRWILKDPRQGECFPLNNVIADGFNLTYFYDTVDFRIVRKIEGFHYETIADSPIIFFEASFDMNRSTKLAFACLLPVSISDNEYIYVTDTLLELEGKKIDCYLFKLQSQRISDALEIFKLDYGEIYFEKASLLPVKMFARSFHRSAGRIKGIYKTEPYYTDYRDYFEISK